MAWYISKDHIDDGDAVGQWNGHFKDSRLETAKRVCTHKFRMYDDDGELYYEGYSNDKNGEKAFDPLDDFGMPNAGCTEIKYLEKGMWETL